MQGSNERLRLGRRRRSLKWASEAVWLDRAACAMVEGHLDGRPGGGCSNPADMGADLVSACRVYARLSPEVPGDGADEQGVGEDDEPGRAVGSS